MSRKSSPPPAGRVAVVAGATRGAGRGIAAMLGEAGATVYCTGRSTRGHPPADGIYRGRKETIEETAELVTARGGRGIAVRVDHSVEAEVAELAKRVRRDSKTLDVLVNDISEGVLYDFRPFWTLDVEHGFRALRQGVHTHIVTARHLVPLLIEKKRTTPGLLVEIGDGDSFGYRHNLFYDLVTITVCRLAFDFAIDLRKHRVAAVALTPGFMRTEYVLDHYGVTERNWRDAVQKHATFAASETPMFVGRAVAALAADPDVMEKSGGVFASWTLAEEYGFADADGSRPHLGRHIAGSGRDAPILEKPLPRGPYRWTLESDAPSTPFPAAPRMKAKARS